MNANQILFMKRSARVGEWGFNVFGEWGLMYEKSTRAISTINMIIFNYCRQENYNNLCRTCKIVVHCLFIIYLLSNQHKKYKVTAHSAHVSGEDY
ncbi:hypothetical protein CUN85_08740 [Methanolobus halotolerans]|uniref:Uncharacterized protein n=1 Tax=Methanolobus halotolerans TaxID=2052935 RepID=A0A4E0PYJ3_9EURY|nr:hypothetical protein CUN85_08740 [Methanolobus halotolerans]